MGNRGQKRADMVDGLPADKRACSSLEFRASSSNSSIQTNMTSTNSIPDVHDNDMDTSSSISASSRSEEEPENYSAYGSCDSDDAEQQHHILREFQRRRSSGDYGRFKRILSSLNEESDPSAQLVVLTELCEVLSFCTENSLSSMTSDSLSPLLVKLAKHDSPDIMLLSIRAITYLCDVYPRSSSFLVRHDAVPALCQRLMAIEYLDVAEQCLQALEKISREQPLACLQGGAIMAVLNYIDFFSTSIQRVALCTVVNICKKLPSECPSSLMEAIPILCNLLQYEDRQLVENVAVCMIKITERVSQSCEMLDKLCNHGLIHQVSRLVNSNDRTTLSQPIYNGLIGLLVKLSSGSVVAFRTLYELNISDILKNILSTYNISHGMSSLPPVNGYCNQACEVLKLLNELLLTSETDEDAHQATEKQSFLVSHPELLEKFGVDILPLLIQVVNSGANLYVCYGCLSVIYKLIYLSKSDMLVELLKDVNIASFLAGVFTRKDHHVLMLALNIAEIILQKLCDTFLKSFIKEGVFFAIDALLTPEKCTQLTFLVFNCVQPAFDSSQKSSNQIMRCLCYAFVTKFSSVAETGSCKIEKDSVHNLAKHIRSNYIAPEILESDKGVTNILQKLRTFSAALDDLSNLDSIKDTLAQNDEKFYSVLQEIVEIIKGSEPISTFEFIESGIVKSFVNYLTNGLYLREKGELHGLYGQLSVIEKRFEVFARLLLSGLDPLHDSLPLYILTRKLQSSLSSLENFPVILSHGSKQRTYFATVPNRRCTTYPCLKVRFVREEGETRLCDCSGDVLTVDPFSSLDAIAKFLWPKVSIKRAKHNYEAGVHMENVPPSVESCAKVEGTDLVEQESVSTQFPEKQQDLADLPQLAIEKAINISPEHPNKRAYLEETRVELAEEDTDVPAQPLASCSNDGGKLLFYFQGKQLEHTLTLYQAILQQQIKEHETITSTKLWSQVYTLKYRKTVEPKDRDAQECFSALDKVAAYTHCASVFYSMLSFDLPPELEKSTPTYDVLFLLRSLEGMNRLAFYLMSRERVRAFAEGRIDNLVEIKISVPFGPQNEFVSTKLTEKLEQQMRDPLAVSIGGMPSWCSQLMSSCPFLFSFETRCKYFRLVAFGPQLLQSHLRSHNNSATTNELRPNFGGLPRKKVLVYRDRILESAAEMMDQHGRHKVLLEVEYNEEVGTGLGPTLEFYTLISHEFQKTALGMWRGDYSPFVTKTSLDVENRGIITSAIGLFPRPWPSTFNTSDGPSFSEVMKKFVLLGQVVAKAIQDGRVLDLYFSKAFYKLILGQELSLYDIQSFDPELGTALLEFQALVDRKKFIGSASGEDFSTKLKFCFRNTKIEDLFLDFTLPGYPDYVLTSSLDHAMVNVTNLEDYVSLVVDATINAGISRQAEAFKSGFNQVFPIEHLQIFTAEELEHLLCGEHDSWTLNELLDNIKFDHGYTASSPPIINLLEIMQEFDTEQQRAFLQFVTGAPRLPPGGLVSLNPKLTIVRKLCVNEADTDLPSVMTCANYLKLPPYSSKDKMKEKLLYATTEGQGSFHLS